MPVTLKLRFPAGRYHATPWGRHVNEGVPEWPPSPWRLLRALVAVWKRTCPDIHEDQVKRVLEPLAHPPRFRLPTHRVAHTRHYMPWEKKGPADRTLVFDTFVAIGRCDPVFVNWPDADLSVDDRTALAGIVRNLTSLGRAEGWVHAELTDESAVWNCEPAPAGPAEGELVPVLCPDPDTAFGSDHYPPVPDAKRLRKGLKPDELLFDCPRWHLCLDTQTIHAEKWPRVPGAKWVNYVLRKPSSTPRPASRPPRNQPTVARFLLDGPVLPLVTDTVRVAEAFRHKVLKAFGRRYGPDARSEVLSGKRADGQPLRSHGHAHYLPTAEGDDGHRITHVTIYAADGLGPNEVVALTSVHDLKLPAGGDRVLSIRAQLIGLGAREQFRGAVPLFKRHQVWESVTPFVAHRHLKRRGSRRDKLQLNGSDPRVVFAELALKELVERREIGVVESVKRLNLVHNKCRPAEFGRSRTRSWDDGNHRAFGSFRLSFMAAVAGPICLGYACHYGMGLFLPRVQPEREGTEN